MSITDLFTTEATVENPGTSTIDAEGVASSTATSTIESCHFQPLSTEERVLGQPEAPTRWRTWWPADSVIAMASQVVVASGAFEGRYEVDGEPSRGILGDDDDHVEAILRRVVR